MKAVTYKYIFLRAIAALLFLLPDVAYSQMCSAKFKTYQEKDKKEKDTVLIRPGFGIVIDSVDSVKIPGTNSFMQKTEVETLAGAKTVVCSYNEVIEQNIRLCNLIVYSLVADGSSHITASRTTLKSDNPLTITFDAIAGHYYEIVGYTYDNHAKWYLRVRDLADSGKEVATTRGLEKISILINDAAESNVLANAATDNIGKNINGSR